ncbi:uncharacterized protein LOC125811848 [Solanum verrucosum]|uniref:uncharacterized protein LOC125811848 n=1 Tax=Solanum verrucosum TaxID=315347 RepID=UPI0020D0EB91|nr:uncharacterized protein LOC125811848 [Solanum verrucosum]
MEKKTKIPPEKKTKIPPLMNAVKDEKNTEITPSSSSSSHQRETNLIDLTIDIQINILHRLSMKSLFQFRSVCKSWRTLLLTGEIAVHLDQVSDKIYTLTTNAGELWYRGIRRFKIPIELQSLEFMLLEPVNGIICIIGPVSSHVTFAYLWNPLTNEFKHLPKPNVQMGYVAVGFGFGFVPKSNDYKVVRVVQHERKFDSHAEVYSLNRGSWRRVKDDSCSSSSAWMNRILQGVVTVDLENEVITEEECRYFDHENHQAEDHRRKHCRTNTWKDDRDAILLTLPVDELVLSERPRSKKYSYRSSIKFNFSGSLVSLSRNHDDLG